MITLQSLQRFLAPIKRKIFLLIGRCILAAVNNSEQTQKVQVTGLKNENITDMERPQPYGFESYPKTGAEVTAGFINGNRDQGLAIVISDRQYRPTTLSEGEVAVYSFKGNIITMKQDGEVHILYDGGTLEYAPLASKIKTIVDNEIMTIFNAHIHSGVQAGGANSGAPTTTMTSKPLGDYQSTGVKIS